jgi:hypothetical protein
MSINDYLVPIEAFEGLVQAFDSQLCPECVKQYEPAACIMLQCTRFSVAHISPVRFRVTEPSFVEYMDTRCCKSTRRSSRHYTGESTIGFAREPFKDLNFIEHLLLHYPKLNNKPITLRTLQEAGCNLETEIAMWQLAKGGAPNNETYW